MIDLKTEKWETLPDMNDTRDAIRNKVCFIDGFAYIAGGTSEEKAEKFDYKQKKWIALPNYPIEDELYEWSSALTFTPEEIKQETKETEETKEELDKNLKDKRKQRDVLLKVTEPQDVIENFIVNSATLFIDLQSAFEKISEYSNLTEPLKQ